MVSVILLSKLHNKKYPAMYKQIIPFIFLIALTKSLLWSQNIENWISANERNPVEKIYIHTYAENFFAGDTVWFKVYLTDSRSGQLIPRAENVYVNLLDESGESKIQLLLLCVNGQASGSFIIPENLSSGNFLMMAYTNYLFNFGADSYFYRKITISKITGNSMFVTKGSGSGNNVAGVTFYPEGGVLLENATNLVAFKASDKLGYGVNIHGTVKDEKGVIVASFSTDTQGMGLFFLTPEAGKSYFATVDGFPSFRYNFEPVKKGIKIQLVNHTSREAIINIAGNSDDLSGETFYLLNMYRGEVLFYQSFTMDGINKVFKFESKTLKPGINKLVLLDNSFKTVSERLLFSRNFDSNELVVETDSKIYEKRSEIKLQINDEKFLSEKDFSSLSVSVIHELLVPENGFSKNILSQFLIDSEINGFINSSADLLVDNEVSSDAKIRLLMLTIDSKDYFWNNAPFKTEQLKFKQESGIILRGIARNNLTNNFIANGEITLAIQKEDEIAFMTQKTDSAGRFVFAGLLFNDSATVHVQAKNDEGKMNTLVSIEPVFKNVVPSVLQLKVLKDKTSEKSGLVAIKYENYSNNKKNQPRKNGKTAQKSTENDGHFRIYESADFVLNVDHNEQSFNNILDYMTGKIPGVDINGDNVRIRGTSSVAGNSMPLFLLDGVPLVGSEIFNLPSEVTQENDPESGLKANNYTQLIQTVRSIPLNDVDKIEVLKSPQNTSVFGVKGSNGVIAIYTRRGELPDGDSAAKGIVENKITGYSGYKEFYSPEYNVADQKGKQTDLRTLLFWKPDIVTRKGTTEIHFFSSDLAGRYKVFIEGIANDGKICTGSAEFEVK